MNDNTLHCGACKKPLEDDTAAEHLRKCPAASAMLFSVTALTAWRAPDPCHKHAHLVFSALRNSHLISEYARAISTEMRSFDRAVIHARLCDRLGLEYHTFRPFESDDIHEVPTQEEAERIIWNAIGSRATAGIVEEANKAEAYRLKAEAEAQARAEARNNAAKEKP